MGKLSMEHEQQMGPLDASGLIVIVGAMTPCGHGEWGHVLSEIDSLMLSLCLDMGHDGQLIADDLMMVELVASLPVIQTTGAPPTMFPATVEDEAPSLPAHSYGLCLGMGHVSQDVWRVL